MVFPIPLGLGLRPPRTPYVTLALSVILIACHWYFEKPDVVALEKKLLEKYEIQSIVNTGLTNFCLSEKSKEYAEECKVIQESIEKNKQQKIEEDSRKISQAEGEEKVGDGNENIIEKDDNGNKEKIDFKGFKDILSQKISHGIKLQRILKDPHKYFPSQERADLYLERMGKVKQELADFKKENNLLTRNNINFLSLLKGQFTHADYFHLFGNLLSFIFFAIYLEARLGSLMFFGAYFLTGTVGLFANAFFLKEGVYLLGASANVLGVVGAFYVLFFKHYFKLYFAAGLTPIPKVLCFSKTFLIKMKFAVPVFFVLGDVSGLVNPQGSIAHLAHLGGFCTGVVFSLIYLKKEKLKWPFIYPSEVIDFNKAMKIENKEARLKEYSRLLKINPMNKEVQEKLLVDITEQIFALKKIDDTDTFYLNKHTEPFVGRACYHKDYSSALDVLKFIPLNLEYSELLKGLSQKQIINLADAALDNGKYFLALKLYDHFLFKSKKKRLLQNKIIKTIENIFDHIDKNKLNQKRIDTLLKSSSTKELYSLWLKNKENVYQINNKKSA